MVKLLKRIGGGVLTVWAAIRWIPDLLESFQATVKYSKWAYAHFSAPRSGLLTVSILVVGIGLIFSETVQRRFHQSRTPKSSNPELKDRLAELAQATDVRIVDRGSGEDRKLEAQRRQSEIPEVVVEYECNKQQEANYRFKPLILHNLGGGTAYEVQVEKIVCGNLVGTFKKVSHIREGDSVAAPLDRIEDLKSGQPGGPFAGSLSHLFMGGYTDQSTDELFTPAQIPVVLHYSNKYEVWFQSECTVEFNYFFESARTTCKPPKVVSGGGRSS